MSETSEGSGTVAGEKISFEVVVRISVPPAVRELGVLRRAFPWLRDRSIAELRRTLRREGEYSYEGPTRAEAEEMLRVCQAGGRQAYIR